MVFADERVIRNVAEVASYFDLLAPEILRHHLNDLGHDFTEWVERSLEDPALAVRTRSIDRARLFQLEPYRSMTGRDPGDSG